MNPRASRKQGPTQPGTTELSAFRAALAPVKGCLDCAAASLGQGQPCWMHTALAAVAALQRGGAR